jgi:hypothetical protein
LIYRHISTTTPIEKQTTPNSYLLLNKGRGRSVRATNTRNLRIIKKWKIARFNETVMIPL